jgi:hypothetical protein
MIRFTFAALFAGALCQLQPSKAAAPPRPHCPPEDVNGHWNKGPAIWFPQPGRDMSHHARPNRVCLNRVLSTLFVAAHA